MGENDLHLVLGALVSRAPKSVKKGFTKFGRLARRVLREGAKIVLKLLFLTRRRLLTKNQSVLSNRENRQKCFIFDSGCTD